MKKALVLALTVLMVLSLATAAFAVEVTYEGKVEVKWSGENVGEDKGQPGFDKGDFEAFVNFDFTKDYGDGVTAGANIKLDPTAKQEAQYILNDDYDADNDDGTGLKDLDGNDKYIVGDVASADAVKLDGAGWIQIERDLFVLKAATKINDQVGRDFGEYKISELPGLKLNLNLIDGLSAYTILNNGFGATNYLAKAEFAQDLFTVGGGIQADAKENKSGFGIYGTANVIDDLTIDAEFGSRNLATNVENNDAITAILGSVAYKNEALALDAKASFLMQDAGFETLNYEDDGDEFFARDHVKGIAEYDYSVIFADVTYNVTDDLELNGAFDYILSRKIDGKDIPKEVLDLLEDELGFKFEDLSYKVGAAYTLDALKFEAWYAAYYGNEVGGKTTYTLADGVDASLEVTSGKAHKDDKDSKLAYTAKISAAL